MTRLGPLSCCRYAISVADTIVVGEEENTNLTAAFDKKIKGVSWTLEDVCVTVTWADVVERG